MDTDNQTTALVISDAPELEAVSESKAKAIKATFEPMVKLVQAVENEYNIVIASAKKEVTKEVMADAKKLRLALKKIRVDGEKKRVEMKDEFLRAGKAVDGANNILKWAITDKENHLKEIEDHFDNMEKERLKDLQIERVILISPYLEDAGERDLSSMEDDVWDSYLSTKKQAHDDRVAAEEKAEEDRIAKEKADAEEQERVRLQNERLKKEAAEREAQLKKEADQRELQRLKEIREREELEKDRIAKEKVEREERESKEREEQEERNRIQKEKDDAHEATLKAEREKQQKLADELKVKEDAEAKATAEAEEARQAELSKGDAEKVTDFIADLEALKTKYTFNSQHNIDIANTISANLDVAIDILKVGF